MTSVDKQAQQLLINNNQFIKEQSPLGKNPKAIAQVAERFLSNSFIYMILNRWHRKKIKFETTRFLDDAIKNINFFFIAWEKIVDKNDIYKPENQQKKLNLNSEYIIKNFYNLGMAIDQLVFLIEKSKNYWQAISFKKKSLSLTLALINVKEVYVNSDPEYEQNQFYKTFISILKEEMLETVDLEWKRLVSNNLKQPSLIDLNELISFTQHCEKILFHFMEKSAVDTLKNYVGDFKKYVEKIEKYKKS